MAGGAASIDLAIGAGAAREDGAALDEAELPAGEERRREARVCSEGGSASTIIRLKPATLVCLHDVL